jgi:uncharacterized protein YggU (UPF0235/DUF167 family)
MLAVRLTPRGGRDAIDGIEQLSNGRRVLKVRVRAAASEGEANAALTGLIAKTLGVPSRDVSLAAGASTRLKRIRVCRGGRDACGGAGENLRHRVIRFIALVPSPAFGGWARPHRAGG